MKKTFLERVDYITKTLGDSIQYSIANIGSSFLPIVSGLLFGVGIYQVFLTSTNNISLSIVMAIMAALGLESVGFNASKRMITSPHVITVFLFFGYIVIGGFSMWFTEIEHSHALITSAAFLLTAINYGLYGLKERERHLSKVVEDNELNIKEQEELEYKRKIEEEQLEYDRKLEEETRQWQIKMKTKRINAELKGDTQVKEDNASNTPKNASENVSSASSNVTYKNLTQEMKAELQGKTVEEIQIKYPHLKKRTAYNWASNLKKEI